MDSLWLVLERHPGRNRTSDWGVSHLTAHSFLVPLRTVDMSERKTRDQDVVPPVLEVLQRIVATLPAGCATLETERRPDGETYVRLIPRNPAAAPIAARGGGELRYELVLGQGTIYEILPGKRPALEALFAVCSAVFAGNFEETVYTVG